MRRLAKLIAAGTLAAAAPLALSPAAAQSCNEACLLELADSFTLAIAEQDYQRLPWADPTYFTENNVPLMIGDSWWGSVGETPGTKAFAIADEDSGNVIWFGTIWDHDEPSYGAVRIQAPEGRIEAIEVIAGRTPWPIPFGDPRQYSVAAEFSREVQPAERRSRERLIDIADAYLGTKQRNNGTLLASFAPGCVMRENGVQITSAEAEHNPRRGDCASVFRAGLFAPVERIRDRRFPAVDPQRGLVVAISVQDVPTRETSFYTTDGTQVDLKRHYPLSRLVAELIKIEGDTVVRTEAVVASLPYYMGTPWQDWTKP